MDELKHRAGEKLEALQVAAVTVADSSKSRVQDVLQQTIDAIQKIRLVLRDIWQHDLTMEARTHVGAWSRDAVQRLKRGTAPLSPVVLYNELVKLFRDRVWRRSVIIFTCGVVCGGCLGVAAGLRAALAPRGPHARALHSHPDQTVLLVEDGAVNSCGPGEVLVRVQAFSASAADRCVLRGRGGALRARLAPSAVSVGRGFAGVVLDTGAGVTELELGDEVWGCVSEWDGGAASELLTIRSTRVSKRPVGLTADSAASLPWAGCLALEAIARLRLTPDSCKGKRVLVCGAASGEGCALLQLLGARGAALVATAPRRAALALADLGASEVLDLEGQATPSWAALEAAAARAGLFDAVLACAGPAAPPALPDNPRALLKSTAPKHAILDLRPTPLLSDRLRGPLAVVFVASFCTLRLLRFLTGFGTHTDWLESPHRLTGGLQTLAKLVESGQIRPVLDKVYLPQDYENALAHACSEDAVGTTVVRFP